MYHPPVIYWYILYIYLWILPFLNGLSRLPSHECPYWRHSMSISRHHLRCGLDDKTQIRGNVYKTPLDSFHFVLWKVFYVFVPRTGVYFSWRSCESAVVLIRTIKTVNCLLCDTPQQIWFVKNKWSIYCQFIISNCLDWERAHHLCLDWEGVNHL